MDLAQQISVNAILAFGLTLVILIGGIDLSVGAVVAFAGVVCVSVLDAAGPLAGLAAGLGAAVLIGLANGVCAARTSMPPFIITLATMLIASGMALGFNGMIHTSQLYSAEPAAGQGFELNAIAAVVVGGTSFSGGIGALPGTLLGSVIIGILDKGLNQAGVHFSLQYIVKGLVILIAVYTDVRRRKGVIQ